MLFYLPEILPASQPWFTSVQPMDLNSIISLKSLLWHPVFGEGRGPYRSSQSICLLFIIRLVSVKEGTVFLLLSAFYFQKHIACLLAHSRCSILFSEFNCILTCPSRCVKVYERQKSSAKPQLFTCLSTLDLFGSLSTQFFSFFCWCAHYIQGTI